MAEKGTGQMGEGQGSFKEDLTPLNESLAYILRNYASVERNKFHKITLEMAAQYIEDHP